MQLYIHPICYTFIHADAAAYAALPAADVHAAATAAVVAAAAAAHAAAAAKG